MIGCHCQAEAQSKGHNLLYANPKPQPNTHATSKGTQHNLSPNTSLHPLAVVVISCCHAWLFVVGSARFGPVRQLSLNPSLVDGTFARLVFLVLLTPSISHPFSAGHHVILLHACTVCCHPARCVHCILSSVPSTRTLARPCSCFSALVHIREPLFLWSSECTLDRPIYGISELSGAGASAGVSLLGPRLPTDTGGVEGWGWGVPDGIPQVHGSVHQYNQCSDHQLNQGIECALIVFKCFAVDRCLV